MVGHLRRGGRIVGRKRVRRLMARMGLIAICQQPKATVRHPQHRMYPCLLRDMAIERPDQVWCADITSIPMRKGFLYLVAIMDWFGRRILAWRLPNAMETDFCTEALEEAVARFGKPLIFRTEQGYRFTGPRVTEGLTAAEVKVSVGGRGRWMDDVFFERLRRSLKYGRVYLNAFETGSAAPAGIENCVDHCKRSRPHTALGGRTPMEAHMACHGISIPA
jgi:putative transposase